MARAKQVEYADENPGTVRELWIYLLVFIGIATLDTITYALRTHDWAKTALVAVWVVGMALSLVRFLRQFVALQLDPQAETTRFVFSVLRTAPIWGLAPTLLLL